MVKPESMLGAELHVVQAAIQPARREQYVVRTALHQPAVGEHDDQVRVAHRREAVCDHEHRAVRHQAVDRLLYEALGLGVEGAGRLVEDQERWIAQQRPRDRDALALPAGEPRAALAQQGVVGLRELGDELVRVRGAGGAAYLLEREVTTAVRDAARAVSDVEFSRARRKSFKGVGEAIGVCRARLIES